jgi:hypothetical protein
MHREESDAMSVCADCGATVDPDRGRTYGGSGGVVLCLSCASDRGGSYDEGRDTWVEAPDVADLIDKEA